MRKLALVVSLLALAMFAVAACGDDDDDETTAAETTTEETTAEQPAGGGAADGAGGTVSVEADPGGQLAFVQDSLDAPAGSVTFEFTNDASLGHDFVIETADGEEVARTEIITGDTTSVDAELEAGTEYTFYCSVDAHREAGMEGPLTVE
ncbi:MAG: plastocyanin/azurin family copper-binding protein [Solirubrobacterales bacterium]